MQFIGWKTAIEIIVIVMVITNNINKLLHVIIFQLKYLIESSNGHWCRQEAIS